MDVALFVPCYVDQLYPQVGLATADLLERLGVTVHFPEAQTCCGQPMANSGFFDDARPLARKMLDVFASYEHVVCPSGSCTSMVRNHYGML
ncbi:MAG TPA: (Fe-S)-binding protein, partial [Myxococcales bacterium]|nr:(Fe-S)-binding protein [Myxococcales bacterium]